MNNQQVQKWIETALADAAKQEWAKALQNKNGEIAGARFMLEDWASDGMFRCEEEVRDQLCKWCDSQIGQVGVANFRTSL